MLVCSLCSAPYPSAVPRWRCDCGSYLRLDGVEMFSIDALRDRPTNLWRYREALGLGAETQAVSLGEGFTPLVAAQLGAYALMLKLDFLCPTGSYKDRGSTVMISQFREWGIEEIVEDSSGNAGASVAAYAAAAGIRARIFVPAHASGGKLAQILQYGAELVRVPGSREDTTTACLAAAEKTFYASHNWSPYFQSGMKTVAYEIAEQLDWQAPDWVVTPVGGGSLLLGLYHGFREMHEAGMVGNIPRIAGVQSVHCPPVYQAWQKNLDDVPGIVKGNTIAEGISVAKPVKGRDILQALRATDGVVLTVDDREVWTAVEALGRVGVSVEPTGAVSAAGVEMLARDGLMSPGQRVVVVLTGSGLKAADTIMEHYAKTSS